MIKYTKKEVKELVFETDDFNTIESLLATEVNCTRFANLSANQIVVPTEDLL